MSKKLTELEFIKKSNDIHNNEYELISEFTATKDYVKLKHICGHKFKVKCYNHLYGKTGCPKCKGGVKLTNSEVQDKLDKVHNGEYTIKEYNGYDCNSIFIHNECGEEFEVITSNLIDDKSKCSCVGNKRWTKELFLIEQREIHGNEYELISDFKNINHKIELKHNKCGHKWVISPKKHIYSKQGCPICNMSYGEKETKKILDSLNIKHNIQHIFNDCRNVRNLSFDFYLPDYNTCIEYDGIQHFQIVERFDGETGYNKRKINDQIKDNYCKDNRINLIRIPYWDLKNIESIINEFIYSYSS